MQNDIESEMQRDDNPSPHSHALLSSGAVIKISPRP